MALEYGHKQIKIKNKRFQKQFANGQSTISNFLSRLRPVICIVKWWNGNSHVWKKPPENNFLSLFFVSEFGVL